MFGKNRPNDGSIDTTVGRSVGGFIKGAAIGYGVVEGASLIKGAMDAKKSNDVQKAKEQAELAEYSRQLDEALVQPHLRLNGECAKYMEETTYEERRRNLTDPTAPGYAEHGKIINDLFDFDK